jgi:hypothetical protein
MSKRRAHPKKPRPTSKEDEMDLPSVYESRATRATAPDAPSDILSDAGVTRPLLKVLVTTRCLDHMEEIPEGTEGLFVWLPVDDYGPNGEELCEVRVAGKTHTVLLRAVRAIGPAGHAEKWNEARDTLLNCEDE